MKDLSLHILDILENSAAAKADLIKLFIVIDEVENFLKIIVEDDGMGMDEEVLKAAQNPFYTTKKHRKKKVGMGIPLISQNAEMCNGFFNLESEKNKGTKLIAQYQYDHIDRLPLGNLEDTIINSILGHPEIDYFLQLNRIKSNDTIEYDFNTKIIKEEVGGIPLSHPDIIKFIENSIKDGIKITNMEEI